MEMEGGWGEGAWQILSMSGRRKVIWELSLHYGETLVSPRPPPTAMVNLIFFR